MPTELPKDAIEQAEAAVVFAQQMRRFHRRRSNRGSAQRATDLALAQQRLRDAMAPLKSEIGKFNYGPQTDLAEANRQSIRDASAALQKERRKLWKMANVKGTP